MSEKAFSAKEEKRLLDTLGRGLLREFPNPERAGCPGSEMLRGIAFHKFPLAQAEAYLDHLTSCSPCYRDFSQFRDAYQLRRKRTLLAVAASILVATSVAGWALVQKNKGVPGVQTAILDLRSHSLTRGTEPSAREQSLELSRTVSRLNIYLPLGSSEGPYNVRIVAPSGESVLTSSGIAKLKDGITSLEIPVGLSSTRPGRYILQVRKSGSEWNSYSVLLR